MRMKSGSALSSLISLRRAATRPGNIKIRDQRTRNEDHLKIGFNYYQWSIRRETDESFASQFILARVALHLRSMQPLPSTGLVQTTDTSFLCTLDVSTTAFTQLSANLVIMSSWRSKAPVSAVSFMFSASADMRNLVNFRGTWSDLSACRTTGIIVCLYSAVSVFAGRAMRNISVPPKYMSCTWKWLRAGETKKTPDSFHDLAIAVCPCSISCLISSL